MQKTSYTIKNTSLVANATQELIDKGIHPIISELYALRGVQNFKDIDLLQKLEPWRNMLNIELAANILSEAILSKKKICVVADYDVDGATSCSIALLGIRMFGGNIDYVVPNRFVHGYGLTPSVVDEVYKKKNPDLIITVDNGVSSHAGVDHAHKKKIKVLVTDHHLAGATLPDADCIVNPNQPGCPFNSKSMAGCGVMFYVLCALRQKMLDLGRYTLQNVPNIFALLDLVAVGTVADVVKLDLNNRIMVKIGIGLIRRKQTRQGIIALADVAKKKCEYLSTMDIGFGLGPRINAAGRLEDMSIGIQTLLTENYTKAHELALKLDEINKKRKKIEGDMKDTALDVPNLNNDSYTKVVFDESFHEGVIGIVASRIKEMFYRPTIVMAPSTEEGYIKGSGRSIPEVHLRDALDWVTKKNPNILAKFGGHAMAAGLTLKQEDLPEFQDLFEQAVKFYCEGKELKNVKEIDLDLPTPQISLDLAKLLRNEIWGQGFNAPLFVGKFKIKDQKILKDQHLKITLEKDGQDFTGMWFFQENQLDVEELTFVYTIGINDFLGRETVQIMIDGILEDLDTVPIKEKENLEELAL